MAVQAQRETEQYDAFISYSGHDTEFARVLENTLEAYKPPPGLNLPLRYLRVFRYEGDMTGSEYEAAIQDKIQKSAKLIVICSPAARQKSEYVDDEICRFVQAKGAENIIPILLSGIPNNEAKPEQAAEMAFPEALCQALAMPLAVNYLGFNPRQDKVNKGEFSNSWYNLLANLYGRSREEIEQRDLKRKQRWRTIITAISLSLMLFFAVIAGYALIQKSMAEIRGKIALSRQLAAQSRSLLESKPDLALLLSVEANRVAEKIQSSGNFLEKLVQKTVPAMSKENYDINEPKQALFAALTVPPYRVRFFHRTGKVMAFSPGGKKFVFLDGNKDLIVYDLATGQQIQQPLAGIKDIGDITDMALSSDGHLLALMSSADERYTDSQNYLTFWEVNTGQPRKTDVDLKRAGVSFRKHASSDTSDMAGSPDGKMMARVIGEGTTLAFYSLSRGGKQIGSIPIRRVFMRELVFSQDGKFLAMFENEHHGLAVDPPILEKDFVITYDVLTKKEVGRLLADTFLTDFAFSPDGKILAAIGGPEIRLWDVPHLRPLRPSLNHPDVREFSFSPDAEHIASIDEEGNIILWKLTGDPLSRILKAAEPEVNSFAFSPDDKKIGGSCRQNLGNLELGTQSVSMHVITIRERGRFQEDLSVGRPGAESRAR
jgi:WD40 repeat protein